MTKTVPDPGLKLTYPSGTAASAYHLPESLDWSSLSAQMKNRVVLVPVHMQEPANLELREQMWREHILGRYLHNEITRDEAIEAVGVDWVKLSERQHEAMMEDIAWAMDK